MIDYNINTFFSSVEDSFLGIRLSSVNNLSSFILELKTSKEYQFAKEISKTDLRFYINEISNRISKLLDSKNDKNYLHPYDIPIASYLFLINELNIDEMINVTRIVEEKELNNLWWSSLMINYLKNLYNNASSHNRFEIKISEETISSGKKTVETDSNSSETLSI